MDAHTHLTMPFHRDYRVGEMDLLKKTIPERTLEAVEIARITLMAGFTTVRDVGASDYIDVGMRNAIASGQIPGPRMLVSVHALGSTGGHCDNAAGFVQGLFGRETGIADGVISGPDQAREAVRFNIKYGADVIKTCATGGVLSLTDDVDTPQLTQAELDALVGMRPARACGARLRRTRMALRERSGRFARGSTRSSTAVSWTMKHST